MLNIYLLSKHNSKAKFKIWFVRLSLIRPLPCKTPVIFTGFKGRLRFPKHLAPRGLETYKDICLVMRRLNARLRLRNVANAVKEINYKSASSVGFLRT